MATTTIAIVVPVLGDTAALSALTERIQHWTTQPAELIVVSAGPDAPLRALCLERGCRYLESVARRGTQLDQGAKEATASILWFLHADAEPHADSLEAIAYAVETGTEGGYFRFRFAGGRTWWKRLLERLTNLRTHLGGIPYGDQGIFARRDAYHEAGGFAHQALFEEVALVKNLRARGRFRALTLPIGVASRRWERDGWCYRSLTNRGLAIRYLLGTPAERLAKRYEGTTVTDRSAH